MKTGLLSDTRKLVAISLVLVLILPVLGPLAPLLAPRVALAASNTTLNSNTGNTTTNSTVPPGLLRAFEILKINIERLLNKTRELNITLPENITIEVKAILEVNATSLTAQQLHDYILRAAKLIREIVKIIAENTGMKIGKLVEKRKMEIALRMMIRYTHRISLEQRQELVKLVAEARAALRQGNITAAKIALDRAWAILAAERVERAAHGILDRIAKAHNHLAGRALRVLEAVSAAAARISTRLANPLAVANMSAAVDSLALIVEAKMLGKLNATNITSLAENAIQAAEQAINNTKQLLANITVNATNTTLLVTRKATSLVAKAEKLLAEAKQALAEGKPVEALVKARIAFMLAVFAQNIVVKGEPIGAPWMPEPIKPWMPGIPGIPWKHKPVLPPQWFEARIAALNNTINKLEEIAANKSRQDLVRVLEKAREELEEAITEYNDGKIAVAIRLYMDAYRTVVIVARQLGAQDLLPVYILEVIRPVMILKHWMHWSIGNITAAVKELEAKIAQLRAKIEELKNSSKIGFFGKRLLAMAENLLGKASSLVENAKKIFEQNKQLAARILERAKQLVHAVEKIVEKLVERIGGSLGQGEQQGTGSSSGSSSSSGGSQGGSGSGGSGGEQSGEQQGSGSGSHGGHRGGKGH